MGSWESALSVRWAGRLPPYGHGTLTYGCTRHGIKRWWLYLTQEQAASVAYGLWLHRMAGSAAEANRFAREYGVVHSPARDLGEGIQATRGGAGSGERV
ncbi:DUF6417 family protein [Streptomyces mirabilis]|uniref:DUF6417 family protein n=1 Tax=Streptomyces mirabilis TaxID=68239 RepID=UPI00369E4F3E